VNQWLGIAGSFPQEFVDFCLSGSDAAARNDKGPDADEHPGLQNFQ